MTERRYTYQEIVDMRRAVYTIMRYGLPMLQSADVAIVEDQLRTYMMAGLTVEDLQVQLEQSRQARARRDAYHVARVAVSQANRAAKGQS